MNEKQCSAQPSVQLSPWESMCQPLQSLPGMQGHPGREKQSMAAPRILTVTSSKLPREQDFPACWALLCSLTIQALPHSAAAIYPRGKWFTGKQILPAG